MLTSYGDYAYRRSAPCPKPTVVEGVRDVIGLRLFDSSHDFEHTVATTLSLLTANGRHFALGFDERDYSREGHGTSCEAISLTRPPERPWPYTRCLKPPPDTGKGERFRKIVKGKDRPPRLCGIQLDGTLLCWGNASGAQPAIVRREVTDLTDEPFFFRSQDGWMGRIEWIRKLYGEGVAEPPFRFPPTEELVSGRGLADNIYDDRTTWLCGRMTTGRIVCALEDRRPALLPALEDVVDLEGTCALRKDGAAYCFAPASDGWRITPFELDTPL